MSTLISYFQRSPYFDRRSNGEKIEIVQASKEKDATGRIRKTEDSRVLLPNCFYSNVSGNKVNQNYLNKYNIFKYVYAPKQLTLQDTEKGSIILINEEIFRVLEDKQYNPTSGFYKYLVGGTGKKW